MGLKFSKANTPQYGWPNTNYVATLVSLKAVPTYILYIHIPQDHGHDLDV